MKPLKLGLDLDGVFADFNNTFAQELINVTGKDLRPEGWTPQVWDWMSALGYTKWDVEATWAAVDRDPLWWASLSPLDGAEETLIRISRAAAQRQIEPVFMTTRHSPTAHWQSVEWLSGFFVQNVAPQVCICANAESKGLMAKALELDIVLDDYTPNLMAVKRHRPETRVVVFDQARNRAPLDRAGLTALGYESVSSLQVFLELVDAAIKERV